MSHPQSSRKNDSSIMSERSTKKTYARKRALIGTGNVPGRVEVGRTVKAREVGGSLAV